MRIQIIVGLVVAIFSATPSFADPMTEVVARLNALEKRNDQLALENAALKQRVSRLEGSASPVVAAVESETRVANSAPSTMTTAAVIQTNGRYETASIATAPQPEPRFTWSGAYVGVHGGGGSGDLSFSDTVPAFFVEPFRDSLEASGGLGGIQLGANKQFGNLVVGGELSVSGARISGSNPACFEEQTLALDDECKARVNWLVTGLARLGYVHDRWLVSGAAGLSVAGAEYDFILDSGVPVPFGSSETLSGFTYGAGINYALTRSVSLGVEYLHADLSADGHALLGDLIGAGKGERDLDLNIGRAQLNVKLGE